MLTAEFHCHTTFSADSLSRPEALLAQCVSKGIGRIAITDHNTIRGARQAQAIDPLRVVVGEELMTTRGELLAYYVQEELPKGLTPQEAIRELRQQGAVISVSHPFDRARNGSWDPADLLEIVPLVDAIETFNARCQGNAPNLKAQAFAAAHNLPGTAGSDAHLLSEVGQVTLRLTEFTNARELLMALQHAQPQGKLSSPFVHFGSAYARWFKKIVKPQT
jgi:predicted metal-dependent phosphoesterase TrpH